MKNTHLNVVFLVFSFFQVCQISLASSLYVEKKSQAIKTLSEQTIQQLLRGDGMGFALAAELNAYPGSKHVLELQNELSLSPDQVKLSHDLFEKMNHQAIVYGETIIQAEGELENLFQTNNATPDNVETLVALISQTQAKLRSLHLVTHIHQLRILTPEQNRHYQQLRGYLESSEHSSHQNGRTHSSSHKHRH